VRLIHRHRSAGDPLGEDDCYAHSYGDNRHDTVELVPLEPTGTRIELSDLEPGNHVSTERLKRQFEERLAARARRRR